MVRAPAELRAADCETGSRAPLAYPYGEVEVVVVGCAVMSGGARVLVAAERFRAPGLGEMVCWLVAPEGNRDIGDRCSVTDPGAEFASDTPLTGGSGISIPRMRGSREGAMYVYAEAAPDVASVSATYLSASGKLRERSARLIPIRSPLVTRLGAARPFAYFVAEIPATADTCRGVALEARDRRGRVVERRPAKPADPPYRSARIALPGSDGCRGRDPLRSSVTELLWLPLIGWRSLPLISPPQVAELLGVDHSAVRRYQRHGLASIRRGKLDWFRTETVESFLEQRWAGAAG